MGAWSLNQQYRRTGTRFRLFVQSPVSKAFPTPETVWVSSKAGTVGPGPSDRRMHVIAARDKAHYEDDGKPPYTGPADPPATPSTDGHFDHLEPGDPGFPQAHMFGCVRRVMDVWETYFGGPLPWHFQWSFKKLEMIPWVDWNNAHFGWGFMEFGHGGKQGLLDDSAYCLNFDVLAHEFGHALTYATVGIPEPERLTSSYRGFHESASDTVALLAALHFDSLIKQVLQECEGNLYLANEVNRIGETSETEQIRVASNSLKMSDAIDVSTPPLEATGKQVHHLAQPLTGAIFDILIEFYQQRLVARGLMTEDFAQMTREMEEAEGPGSQAYKDLAATYRAHPAAFGDALREARDMMGRRLARCWHMINPADLDYPMVARHLITADRHISGDRNTEMIRANMERREIATH